MAEESQPASSACWGLLEAWHKNGRIKVISVWGFWGAHLPHVCLGAVGAEREKEKKVNY